CFSDKDYHTGKSPEKTGTERRAFRGNVVAAIAFLHEYVT
ncbi:hypothetical protein TIFTF001_053714, partial [Ficus carica]